MQSIKTHFYKKTVSGNLVLFTYVNVYAMFCTHLWEIYVIVHAKVTIMQVSIVLLWSECPFYEYRGISPRQSYFYFSLNSHIKFNQQKVCKF